MSAPRGRIGDRRSKETLTEKQAEDARVTKDQIQQILDGIDPDVPTEHRSRLRNLLVKYVDILSRDEFDMGLTDLIQHDIDTGQERPVRQALEEHRWCTIKLLIPTFNQC